MPAAEVVTEFLSSPKRRSTVVYVGNESDFQRYSDEDDDVSDDPAWYHAPRGSVQPALPLTLLQKKESQSSDSASTEASDPVSPQSNRTNGSSRQQDLSDIDHEQVEDEDDDDDEDNDYFPSVTQPVNSVRPSNMAATTPAPRRSSLSASNKVSVAVQVRSKGSTSKLSDVKRLSLERLSGSDASRQSDDSEPRKSVMKSKARKSFQLPGYRSSSMDMRGSTDMRGSMDLGGRESMMKYRPSDLNMQDMKANFMTRDSLATLVDGSGQPLLSRSSMSLMPCMSDVELPELLRAAKTGNVMLLKACLQDRETDITQRDPVHGQTALHLAVRHGQFVAVRMLVQKKNCHVLVDAVDSRDNTPLHLAAARSRRVTKFLLEQANADVTKVNSRGQTPLGVHILTTKRDEPLIAEMLLQHKADANTQLDESTLLHKAVDLKLFEIAYRLVRYGARLDIKDENGKMVFDKVNRKVLRQLINKISFPPVWVPNEERSNCMLCSRKFSKFCIGVRRHHCRHCGRLCCGQCSNVSVESVAFPPTFENRLKKGSGARNEELKRVCKTCSAVFNERQKPEDGRKKSADFMSKAFGCEWEEVGGQQNAPRQSSMGV